MQLITSTGRKIPVLEEDSDDEVAVAVTTLLHKEEWVQLVSSQGTELAKWEVLSRDDSGKPETVTSEIFNL